MELDITGFDENNNEDIITGKNKFKLNFSARLCIAGERLTFRNTCELCAPNTYSFDPVIEPSERCLDCPEFGICSYEMLVP